MYELLFCVSLNKNWLDLTWLAVERSVSEEMLLKYPRGSGSGERVGEHEHKKGEHEHKKWEQLKDYIFSIRFIYVIHVIKVENDRF